MNTITESYELWEATVKANGATDFEKKLSKFGSMYGHNQFLTIATIPSKRTLGVFHHKGEHTNEGTGFLIPQQESTR